MVLVAPHSGHLDFPVKELVKFRVEVTAFVAVN